MWHGRNTSHYKNNVTCHVTHCTGFCLITPFNRIYHCHSFSLHCGGTEVLKKTLKCFREWKSLMSKPKFCIFLFVLCMRTCWRNPPDAWDPKTVNISMVHILAISRLNNTQFTVYMTQRLLREVLNPTNIN